MVIDSIFKYFLANIIYNRDLNYAEIKALCFILSGLTLILLLSLAILCIFGICSYVQNRPFSCSIKKFTFKICLFFLSIFSLLISLILILLPSFLFSIDKLSFAVCCTITLSSSILCFFLIIFLMTHPIYRVLTVLRMRSVKIFDIFVEKGVTSLGCLQKLEKLRFLDFKFFPKK